MCTVKIFAYLFVNMKFLRLKDFKGFSKRVVFPWIVKTVYSLI